MWSWTTQGSGETNGHNPEAGHPHIWQIGLVESNIANSMLNGQHACCLKTTLIFRDVENNQIYVGDNHNPFWDMNQGERNGTREDAPEARTAICP